MIKRLSAVFVGVLLISVTPVRAEESQRIKIQVTCYAEPGAAYTGTERTNGVVASKVEWVGCAVNVWKVDGEAPGDFLGTWEILDIGYGHAMESSGFHSELKGYEGQPVGTVETGLTLDFRQPDYSACMDFMKETFTGGGSTGSEVYVQIVRGEG